MPKRPKATGATDDRERDATADVQRYERLRRDAAAGETGEWRHGLALLQRRGLAAWARAWLDQPDPRRAAPRPLEPAPAATGGELAGALATIALACAQAR